jgi:glutathione S-transferase
VLRRLETLRPESLRSAYWIARYEAAVHRTLIELATHVRALPDAVTIGTITVGCALWYLDRRYAEVSWREREPDLAEWFEVWNARPAAAATAPPPDHPAASEAVRSWEAPDGAR